MQRREREKLFPKKVAALGADEKLILLPLLR
jgi:hypothetical protein